MKIRQARICDAAELVERKEQEKENRPGTGLAEKVRALVPLYQRSLAADKGELFMRTDKALWCIAEK